jgi:hypothetical protein
MAGGQWVFEKAVNTAIVKMPDEFTHDILLNHSVTENLKTALYVYLDIDTP